MSNDAIKSSNTKNNQDIKHLSTSVVEVLKKNSTKYLANMFFNLLIAYKFNFKNFNEKIDDIKLDDILNEELNNNDLKTWAFQFAKKLQLLNASEISVISRGKLNFAYEIKKNKKGNFLQINFLSTPKNIKNFCNRLKLDVNVVRFNIIKKI